MGTRVSHYVNVLYKLDRPHSLGNIYWKQANERCALPYLILYCQAMLLIVNH